MSITPGVFNNKRHKKRPLATHAVLDYRARDDFVVCNCGFTGTVEQYEAHHPSKIKRFIHYKEMAIARMDYPYQGTINSYRDVEK